MALGLEGLQIQARPFGQEPSLVQPQLARGDQERHLRGVALGPPRARRSSGVRTQALAIIRGHEEEERKRLATEKEGLEAELATLTATASRMLHGPQAQASAYFVVSELARIDGPVGQVKERLVHLVVERVTVHQDGIELALRADGVAGVVRELRGGRGDGGNGGFAVAPRRSLVHSPASAAPTVPVPPATVVVHVPMRFKRRSGRKEIVFPTEQDATRAVDPAAQSSLVREAMVVWGRR